MSSFPSHDPPHGLSPSIRSPLPAAGVEAFDVNLETQKVTVKGNVTLEAVMDKIAKTGKEVSVWMD